MNATQRLQAVLTLQYGALGNVKVAGFSAPKRALLKRYLRLLGVGSPHVTSPQAQYPAIAWGATPADNCIARVEDGFIRSVGLGADLVRPLSWVFDTRGIYFDASRPSDLEWLLQNKDFSASELARAAQLRSSLVAAGITKYNVGSAVWHRSATAKRVVLVAGQVETDVSIRLGSHAVLTNAQLLQATKAQCPGDYIVYKPHPDVVAGLRAGGVPPKQALQWCDEVVTHADMAELLGQVDAVHVITSLAGFEALMRGLDVTCYGTPFYAGWGLCHTPHVLTAARARRTRRLSMDQLVCGALVDYPSYLHPEKDELITVEEAVALLKARRADSHRTDAGTVSSAGKLKRLALAWLAKAQGRY